MGGKVPEGKEPAKISGCLESVELTLRFPFFSKPKSRPLLKIRSPRFAARWVPPPFCARSQSLSAKSGRSRSVECRTSAHVEMSVVNQQERADSSGEVVPSRDGRGGEGREGWGSRGGTVPINPEGQGAMRAGWQGVAACVLCAQLRGQGRDWDWGWKARVKGEGRRVGGVGLG